jgi:hypothetical protein
MNFTPFTGDELATIKSLMATQELDATQVLRQALRHYQMAVQGKPEPTPPVSADGKTPGDIAYEAFINGSDSWEAAASAVLAAFGQPSLEAATRHDGQPADQPLLQPEPEVFVNGAGNPVSPPVPAWQPAVGDVVRLKSGGDALTVTEYDDEKNQWRCVGLTGGCPCYLCVPADCLISVLTFETSRSKE